jgi:hypothetical protein
MIDSNKYKKIDWSEVDKMSKHFVENSFDKDVRLISEICKDLGITPSQFEFKLNKYRPQNFDEVDIDPEKYQINLADNVPDPIAIFKIGGVLLCSPGNLLTIKAKQKGGKTFLVSCFIAAYFTGKYLEIEGFKTKNIAWIDTEQSLPQCHKILRRTHKMAEFIPMAEYPELKVYYASELDTQQRETLIKTIAKDPENGILFIDVSTDIINDINDPVETKAAVDRLQQIAKENNILIICTIHTNKKDENATGFFGGSLQKKSEAVISLTKSDGIFTVSATDTRHGDWPDFSFRIDEDGLPVSVDAPIKMTSTQIKEGNIQNNLRHVLAGKRLTFTEFIEGYVNRELCSESTAKRHIKTAIEKNWIKIQSDNRYILSKNEQNENED